MDTHTVRRALRRPPTAIGLCLIAAFAFVAIAAPWLAPPRPPCPSLAWYLMPDVVMLSLPSAPCRPQTMPRDGVANKPMPPNAAAWHTFPPDWRRHPLGTTQYRYDIYYGLVWGTRTALGAGLLVVISGFLIGLVVGATSGYRGGWVDGTSMRVVDFMFALPYFLAILVVVAVFGRGFDRILLVLVLFWWPGYARYVRGITLSLRQNEYVLAARAVGAGDVHILRRHILPNLLPSTVVLLCIDLGAVVGLLAALSFLGLGAGAATADWGNMINLSRDRVVGLVGGDAAAYWYTIVFPAAAIFLLVLAWNLVGDGLRDAADPRLMNR